MQFKGLFNDNEMKQPEEFEGKKVELFMESMAVSLLKALFQDRIASSFPREVMAPVLHDERDDCICRL